MSGDWIKLHRKLLDSDLVSNHWLFSLWCWCLLKANYRQRHGILPGQFVTGCHSGAEQLGVSKSRFHRGLQELERRGMISKKSGNQKTVVTICKWETYQSDDDDERETSGKRAGNERETSGKRAGTIEEGKKGRRKEGKKPPYPPGGIPDSLDSEEFRTAWEAWTRHRAEIKHALTPSTIKLQLAKLEKFGHKRAIAAIKHSIENGWQGLFEPKDTNGKPPDLDIESVYRSVN